MALGLDPPRHPPTLAPPPQEFAAGKHLLSGEYELPSGMSLPFAAMIAKLKRARMMGDIMVGGAARGK
jgi:hypothetical protein